MNLLLMMFGADMVGVVFVTLAWQLNMELALGVITISVLGVFVVKWLIMMMSSVPVSTVSTMVTVTMSMDTILKLVVGLVMILIMVMIIIVMITMMRRVMIVMMITSHKHDQSRHQHQQPSNHPGINPIIKYKVSNISG